VAWAKNRNRLVFLGSPRLSLLVRSDLGLVGKVVRAGGMVDKVRFYLPYYLEDTPFDEVSSEARQDGFGLVYFFALRRYYSVHSVWAFGALFSWVNGCAHEGHLDPSSS
jgi:hypothetical protein